MDSELKFTEGIESIYISSSVDEVIKNIFLKYTDGIMEALSSIPPDDLGTVTSYAFVVKSEVDYFFLADVFYESELDVVIGSLGTISLDEFLDYINVNQHLKYGI
jgi:hypothetical protein